jgi:hypothetical protein
MHTHLVTRARTERGAVGLLFGVLLGTGVLFGMVALSFDYGLLNAEHSELQASADAAALKAAQVCATSKTCPDVGSLTGIAQLNDSGSEYRSQVVAPLCGYAPSVTNPPRSCVDDNGRITLCPAVPGWVASGHVSFIQVHTRKRTDHVFAGNGSTTGQACAAAAWGTPSSLTTIIPFTVGACEFTSATGANPTDLTGGTFPSANIAIALNYKANATCSTFNGHDFPGGFGWLDTEVNCQAVVKAGNWVSVNPGMGKANECDPQISAAVGTVVFLPVYDCISKNDVYCDSAGSGTQTDYHLAGLAAFQLDGFSAPSYSGNNGSTDGLTCPGKAGACMYGHFVKAVVPLGSIDTTGGSPNLGLSIIETIG